MASAERIAAHPEAVGMDSARLEARFAPSGATTASSTGAGRRRQRL